MRISGVSSFLSKKWAPKLISPIDVMKAKADTKTYKFKG